MGIVSLFNDIYIYIYQQFIYFSSCFVLTRNWCSSFCGRKKITITSRWTNTPTNRSWECSAMHGQMRHVTGYKYLLGANHIFRQPSIPLFSCQTLEIQSPALHHPSTNCRICCLSLNRQRSSGRNIKNGTKRL